MLAMNAEKPSMKSSGPKSLSPVLSRAVCNSSSVLKFSIQIPNAGAPPLSRIDISLFLAARHFAPFCKYSNYCKLAPIAEQGSLVNVNSTLLKFG
jgi:hypothetical protein